MEESKVVELCQVYHDHRFEAQKKLFVIASQQRLEKHYAQGRNLFEREIAEDKFFKENGIIMTDYEWNIRRHKLIESQHFRDIAKMTEEKMKAFV